MKKIGKKNNQSDSLGSVYLIEIGFLEFLSNDFRSKQVEVKDLWS